MFICLSRVTENDRHPSDLTFVLTIPVDITDKVLEYIFQLPIKTNAEPMFIESATGVFYIIEGTAKECPTVRSALSYFIHILYKYIILRGNQDVKLIL